MLAVLTTHAPETLQAADWRVATLAELTLSILQTTPRGRQLTFTFSPHS